MTETEKWTVYLIECSDSTYYCGVCKMERLKKRIEEHNQDIGAKYTRARSPVSLLINTRALSKQQAYQTESFTKKLHRNKKLNHLKKI